MLQTRSLNKVASLFRQTMNSRKILSVEESLNQLDVIRQTLRDGGVIAVPTDTIYGLACLACNKQSLARIYEIKGRVATKPLAICVGQTSDLRKWSKVTVTDEQLEHLLPGPVTLVFEREATLPAELNPNTTSIGIRIPNHRFMIELARHCNEPIALTSANVSNEPSSLCIQEFEVLWKDLDLIVDGGELSRSEKAKLGSTVIDLTEKDRYSIIREGSEYEMVSKILNDKCLLKKAEITM